MKTEKTVDIRDIQKVELEILKSFKDICEEFNLTYYLSGGTFIGAVRHQGFIPWDDDVDVAMPRKDYNEFLKVAQEKLPNKYQLIHYTKGEGVIHHMIKIENSTYQLMDCTASSPRTVNVWIDIFPLDGLPNNYLLKQIHCFKLLALRALFKYSLFDTIVDCRIEDRPWYEKILFLIGTKIKFDKILDPYRRMKAIDKCLSRYDFYESKYIMNFMGSYKFKSIMDREKIYAEGAKYSFEGIDFNAPKNYDLYLTQIYGDYMKLPPESQRNKHQTVILSIDREENLDGEK